jgi:hypothetical protein
MDKRKRIERMIEDNLKIKKIKSEDFLVYRNSLGCFGTSLIDINNDYKDKFDQHMLNYMYGWSYKGRIQYEKFIKLLNEFKNIRVIYDE